MRARRFLREPAPAAADLEHALPRREPEQLGDGRVFALLRRFERLAPVREKGRGIGHAAIEPERVEIVPEIVVIGDVALAAGPRVAAEHVADALDRARGEAAVGVEAKRALVHHGKLHQPDEIRAIPIAIHIGFGKADRAAEDEAPRDARMVDREADRRLGAGVPERQHRSARRHEREPPVLDPGEPP